MSTVAMTPEQQSRLQAEVQRELEKREWADPGDNVMAEYVTVLIANGSAQTRVQEEMDDLVGADFDPQFLNWLFDKASDIQQSGITPAPVSPVRQSAPSPVSSNAGGSRLLSSALASSREDTNKRKADSERDGGANKKRLPDMALPSAPRAMGSNVMGSEGRSLQSRLSGRQANMNVRGMAGGGRQQQQQQQPGQPAINPMAQMNMGMMGNFQPGFRPPNQNMMQGQNFGGFFQPGQQEMMTQMMMMQANMAQMGEMMAKMVEEKDKQPQQPIMGYATEGAKKPLKIPHGTKLGNHGVSSINPKSTTIGPIPDKPASKALCRYSIGCSNSRCVYSHPSPASDEKTGMVLSDEPCEEGKKCKDPECTKSHVSPAATLGDAAGPSRLLCKYQNCTNPSCPFRHEDAEGNPIPPPALTASKAKKEAKPAPTASTVNPSSDNEDGDVEVVMHSRTLLDGALDDEKPVAQCRYGERCTRPDCKFNHPASRPTPKPRGSYNPRGGMGRRSNGNADSDGIGSGGMNVSKKFATANKESLDATAGEFVPKATPEVEGA